LIQQSISHYGEHGCSHNFLGGECLDWGYFDGIAVIVDRIASATFPSAAAFAIVDKLGIVIAVAYPVTHQT